MPFDDVERLTFPDGGGVFDLGLAIPRLADMDDVVVDEAELSIVALPNPFRLDAPAIEARDDGAVVIDLGGPSRLTGVDLVLSDALPDDGWVLLSAAEPGAAEAPMFAANSRDPQPKGLYPAPLTGMTLSGRSGAARLTFAQPVAGRRWVVRVVTGDTAAELEPPTGPVPTITVAGAEADASPRDVHVTIPADTGDEPVVFAGSGDLLPGPEPRVIAFTPLAERHLRAAMATSGSSPDLLAVPLRVASASAGVIGVPSRVLRAHYVVRLVPEPVVLALAGGWATIPMSAPASRRPRDGAGTLEARLAGRRLDPGAPTPPMLVPASGVIIAPRALVASAAQATVAASGHAPLLGARVLLAADRPAEVVLELRADAAGLPGPTLASVVRRVAPGPGTWQPFILPTPVDLQPPARLWCALRTNDQPVRWFTGDAGSPPVRSLDDGATWGSPSLPLGDAAAGLVQLLCPDDDGTPPGIDAYVGDRLVATFELQRADAHEASSPIALPPAVLDALAAASGAGRVTTALRVFSRTEMTLTVRDLTCAYDPTA